MAVWKTQFVPEHLKTDQSQIPIILHSLYILPVAVLTVPAYSASGANHTNSAKHIVDSHVFFQTRTHLH